MSFYCLQCGNKTYQDKVQEIMQLFKGKEIKVKTEARVCDICDLRSLSDAQATALVRKVKEAYENGEGEFPREW